MHPGHRHDSVGRIEGRHVERRPAVQPVDRVARCDLAAQVVLADFRIEIADAKPPQAVLAGKVLDDADEPVDAIVAARVTRRADYHRHPEPTRREQHVLEIVLLPLQRARRDVRAERPRADIARSRLGADKIGRAAEPDLKTRRLDRRKAEMPVSPPPKFPTHRI